MTDNKLMNIDGTIPGLEVIDPTEDVVIPRYKADCHSGAYINSVDGSQTKELECIFLSLRKGRIMWEKGLDKPKCKSQDRITGTEYGNCADCSKRLWQPDGGKPLCHATYEFLLLKDDSPIPYAMTVSTPTSMGRAKKYITYFVTHKKPLFAVNTILSMEKKTNAQGTYYLVTFERGKEVEPERLKGLMKLMSQWRVKDVAEEGIPEQSQQDEELSSDLPF